MAALWAYGLIATVIFRLSSSACKPALVQDGPVLTRVTEPVAHGEGPHWDPAENVLYYVDISGRNLHRYDPATKTDLSLKFGTIGFEQPVGNVEMNKATFYRLDNDPSKPCAGDVELRPVSISNGLTWSHDNKVLYYIDTPTRRVDAFNFDLENGTISNQRTVFSFGEVEGNPDGMTIDADGNLWIACWGGSQVIRVDPRSGKLLRSIKMPASRVSSVAWGGPGLDTLYVTTMRLGLNKTQLLQEPHAGSVWEISNLKTIGTLQHTAVVNCKCKQ